MSIDDMVTRDTRVLRLAKACGWNRREAIGCLLDVWQICYDRITECVAPADIDAAAERDGFSEMLISCELATRQNDGMIRIAGASERINYLRNSIAQGRIGGLKSAESRRKRALARSGKRPSTVPKGSVGNPVQGSVGNPHEGVRNLPDPVPDVVPDPVPVPDPAVVPDQDTDRENRARSRGRPKKSFAATPGERDSVRVVLGKLSGHNGVKYSGSDPHVRLIVNQLRAGVTELDLRKVIHYCANEAFPEDKPALRVYLRPETLFGPETIARYLDAARAWHAKHFPEADNG